MATPGTITSYAVAEKFVNYNLYSDSYDYELDLNDDGTLKLVP